MSFIKILKWVFAGCVLLPLLSCTEKVETGSVLKDFTGVEGVEALSPTAVRVFWNLHDRYKTYKVYNNQSATAVAETSFSEVTIRNLNPGTAYTFKVVATDGTNMVGGNKELSVSTMTRFTGVDKVIKDSDGNLILSWVYPNKVSEYQIFYKKYEDPTSTNTNNWAAVDYTSIDTKYTFRGLEGSIRYHFVVQVKYLDDTYEYPTKSVNIFSNSTFPTPTFNLSPISIGSLPFVKVDPVVNSTYKNENYVSRMYYGDSPVSDPMTGAGTIVLSSSANFPNGKVEGLALHVSYSEAGKTETLIFDKLSTYIKGILGIKESPPLGSLDAGVAFMGEAMSTGDFNCDGYPDLAIGLPNISISSLGAKWSATGAVYVYYSYKPAGSSQFKLKTDGIPSRTPVKPGEDPQVITFDDLNDYARFGKSLSGNGNLNGDSLFGKACQDLIVGAPGYNLTGNGNSNTDHEGAAFVFFGSAQGLTAPSRIKDIQQNVETCNGLVEGATCSAVMLWPNMALYPSAYYNTSYAPYSNSQQFGFSVSFIGDFNADGYDDLAIGAPTASWDGVANATASGNAQWVFDAGFVALYFGSKSGLGYETPFASGVPGTSDTKFRFLKIFAPVPHDGQQFGYSVAGGADVDGLYKIRDANDKLVGGSDLIIGAPGDIYPKADSLAKLKLGGACPDLCASMTPIDGGWGGLISGTNYYGMPVNTAATLGTAPGAAYLYFGRGAVTPPAAGNRENPSRNTFWKCGRRKMNVQEHFSCLADPSSMRVLFPRSYYKTDAFGKKLTSPGFGTAVALVGDPSRYDSNNTPLTKPSDTNGDGYAEAVVAASYFSNFDQTNSGALWTFYGNPFKLYEQNSFYQIDTVTPTNRDLDWNDSLAQCDSFTVNNAVQKQKCAPTLIRSNSISANYILGRYPETIAVGDVTGDGLKDVLVGAMGDTTKGAYAGAAYAFTSLKSSGLTTNFLKFYNTNSKASDYFGRSVAIGNFDGDFSGTTPLNDVVIGAYLDKSQKNGGGGVFGYNSNGQPLSSVNSVPAFSIYDSLASPQQLGYESTRIVGDINRDGYADAVAKISRPSANGTAYTTEAVVYFGSKIGLITTSFCKANLNRIFKAGQANDLLCYPSVNPAQGVTLDDIALPQLISKPTNLSVTWANRAFDVGDVNGDGFGDVAFLDYNTGGQIVIYYGSRGGLQAVNNPQWVPAYGDPQIVTRTWASMSMSSSSTNNSNILPSRREVIVHGDFNGDGISDIVISNPLATSFFTMNKGAGSYVPAAPVSGSPPAAGTGWQCEPVPDSSCTAGTQAWEMGRVWIYYGSASGLQTPKMKGYTGADLEPAVTNAGVSANTTYMVDTYGSESAVATNKACTGTTTKNCKMQFLYDPFVENVQHGYDNMLHHFGASVAVIDYDHDGIDDLVISAPDWEDAGCYYGSASDDVRRNYGRIFMYKGSANGVIASVPTAYYNRNSILGECTLDDEFQSNDPTMNVDGSLGATRALMPPIFNGTLGTNKTSRRYGWQVASAGDLNNDGYEDLIVTAPFETPKSGLDGAGISYVYYGPLCGADNHTDMWKYLGNHLNSQLEFSDPNISVGITAECMRASGTPKPAPQPFYVWDARPGDSAGYTVMSGRPKKGDFNGDGLDDVILGSPYWDDQVAASNDFGRGVAFFGSPKGLYTSDYPDSVVVADPQGQVKPFIIQNTDDAVTPMFYFANTSAGDVNGDGTMDIMVPTEWHGGYSPILGVKLGTFYLLY